MSGADAIATDGSGIDLDGAPTRFFYNGDGTVNYIEVTSSGNTYRQTFTWESGNISVISSWVKQ